MLFAKQTKPFLAVLYEMHTYVFVIPPYCH